MTTPTPTPNPTLTPWPGGYDPPVDADTPVVMRFRNGWTVGPVPAGKYIWRNRQQPGDIVAWRRA